MSLAQCCRRFKLSHQGQPRKLCQSGRWWRGFWHDWHCVIFLSWVRRPPRPKDDMKKSHNFYSMLKGCYHGSLMWANLVLKFASKRQKEKQPENSVHTMTVAMEKNWFYPYVYFKLCVSKKGLHGGAVVSNLTSQCEGEGLNPGWNLSCMFSLCIHDFSSQSPKTCLIGCSNLFLDVHAWLSALLQTGNLLSVYPALALAKLWPQMAVSKKIKETLKN